MSSLKQREQLKSLMSLSIKNISFLQTILYSLFSDFCLKSVKDVGKKSICVEIQGSVSKMIIYCMWVLVLLHLPTGKFSVLLQPLLRSEILIFQGALHSYFLLGLVSEIHHKGERKEPLNCIVSPTCSLAIVSQWLCAFAYSQNFYHEASFPGLQHLPSSNYIMVSPYPSKSRDIHSSPLFLVIVFFIASY